MRSMEKMKVILVDIMHRKDENVEEEERREFANDEPG